MLDALADALRIIEILHLEVIDLRLHDAAGKVLDDAVAAHEQRAEEVAVRGSAERFLGEHAEA